MRSHRRLRASLYQLGASATNSVQSLHAANWALRMVLSGVQNDLLSQDADLFLRSVGPFLLWSRVGMKRFLECFSGDPERLASLAAMAPADAWRHFAGDPGLDAAGTLASFRVADPARFQRTLQVSLRGLEKSLALAADPLADNIQRLRPLVLHHQRLDDGMFIDTELLRRLCRAAMFDVVVQVLCERNAVRPQPLRRRCLSGVLSLLRHGAMLP